MSEKANAQKVQGATRERSAGKPQTSDRQSIQPAFDSLFGLQRDLGNQAMLSLLQSGLIQTKLRVSQPADADEQEADRVADHIVSSQRAPAIQRKCACGGTCAKCAGEQPDELIHRSVARPALRSFPLSLQRAPADPSATSTAGAAPPTPGNTSPQAPGKRHSGPLIVEDDATSLAPGQMRKSQFIALLRTDACATADAVLGSVGHSTKSCPYIEKWLRFYEKQDSQHIERAVRKYAPETATARSAYEAISLVVVRIRRAAITWAKTGKVEGLPEELASQFPGQGGFLGAVRSFASSGVGGAVLGFIGGKSRKEDSGPGSVSRKARNEAAAPAHDAAAVKAELGTGHSLDARVQSQMSSAFGHDFSGVRMHTDSRAAALSSDLQARAFTVGSDVAFASGEYKPGTLVGDALIAHELAHVVQQGGGQQSAVPMQKSMEGGGNQLEEDADRSAVGAVASAWAGARKGLLEIGKSAMPRLRSGLRLQRCNDDSSPKPKTEPEIACTAQAIGKNVAECMERANKQAYSCMQGIHYATNYQRECPDKWKEDYRKGYADPTYFDQLEGAWDWRLRPKKSASAAIKKWLSGLTIAECLTTTIACEIDAIRAAIGDARFDSLYGSADKEIPEDRRLRVGRTAVPNVSTAGLLTKTEAAGPGGSGTPGNRPAKVGEWYYFKNHPMYLKKHPGGDWRGENSVYVGLSPEGKQLWIGLGSSAADTGQPEVTEDQMLDELVAAYKPDPWGPDLPALDRIRAAHSGTLPPEYQPKSAANPAGYPPTITKQELIQAGGGFIGASGRTLDVSKVKELQNP